MEKKLSTITMENHPDWYAANHRHFLEKVERAKRIISMLEAVSGAVGECYSPSILLVGLGTLGDYEPYSSRTGTAWIYDGGKRAGIVTIGHSFCAPDVFGQYDDIYARRDKIYSRHSDENKSHGKDEYGRVVDPAFEIIRHLNNNGWGRGCVSRNTSYPNPVADRILDELA